MIGKLNSWLKKRQRLLLAVGAALGGVAALVLILGPIAFWATPATGLHGKDKADAVNATRQTLLTAVGGLVLLTGAAFTIRAYYLSLQVHELSRRGQLTDRYTKRLVCSDRTRSPSGSAVSTPSNT